MSDIVERLRSYSGPNVWNSGTMLDAADEIERLRAALHAYRMANKWATGTEEHRLAIEAADKLNPQPYWYDL